MATLFINEYADVGRINGAIQAPKEPYLATQTVGIAGSSAQSSAFNAKTRMVALSTDVVCSVAFGANPTALATSFRLPANSVTFWVVDPTHKVAVIEND